MLYAVKKIYEFTLNLKTPKLTSKFHAKSDIKSGFLGLSVLVFAWYVILFAVLDKVGAGLIKTE